MALRSLNRSQLISGSNLINLSFLQADTELIGAIENVNWKFYSSIMPWRRFPLLDGPKQIDLRGGMEIETFPGRWYSVKYVQIDFVVCWVYFTLSINSSRLLSLFLHKRYYLTLLKLLGIEKTLMSCFVSNSYVVFSSLISIRSFWPQHLDHLYTQNLISLSHLLQLFLLRSMLFVF